MRATEPSKPSGDQAAPAQQSAAARHEPRQTAAAAAAAAAAQVTQWRQMLASAHPLPARARPVRASG